MSEYGLTPNGPNIKRLEDILDELHDGLSERWGVNTKQNPQSLINHLLTNFADAIAELWEYGENIYYSQYPSTAEGTSLDNAAQFGGSTRETAARSYYPIHCTGIDGTVLEAGTKISSTTNPTTYLSLFDDKVITRSSFNKAAIKVASAGANRVYTVAINGDLYSINSADSSEANILNALASAITDTNFTVSVDTDTNTLNIEAVDVTASHVLTLSETLTTESVTSILNFGTDETGDICLPSGVITNIVKAEAGLMSVVNLCAYIAGRDEESDTEFRQSYIDKIFNRSDSMLESIRSSILNNVQGVKSVAAYENSRNVEDDNGRPPHSIEIVVDGGDSNEIAKQILDKKAGGIATYGDTTVTLTGAYDEDIDINFSRPETVYVWFKVTVSFLANAVAPANYADLIKDEILSQVDTIDAGVDVIPQQFMSEIYRACDGVSYIDISLFSTADSSAVPNEYSERSVNITSRQKSKTTDSMIEVVLNE